LQNTTKIVSPQSSILQARHMERAQSQVPHARPETPRHVTHNHDEDCSDDESDENRSAHSDLDKLANDMSAVKMAPAVVDSVAPTICPETDSGVDLAAPCMPAEASEAISERTLVD
jgi:hypothetical protein